MHRVFEFLQEDLGTLSYVNQSGQLFLHDSQEIFIRSILMKIPMKFWVITLTVMTSEFLQRMHMQHGNLKAEIMPDRLSLLILTRWKDA